MCSPGCHQDCGSSFLSVLLLFHRLRAVERQSHEMMMQSITAQHSCLLTISARQYRLFGGSVLAVCDQQGT